MSKFSIKPQQVRTISDEEKRIANLLGQYANELNSIRSNMRSKIKRYSGIDQSLGRLGEKLIEHKNGVSACQAALINSIEYYNKAEAKLLKVSLSGKLDFSQKGAQGNITPDYEYAKDVQSILDKLKGKARNPIEWAKYLEDLISRASFTDPSKCTLTKAEKEAILRWIGPAGDVGGAIGTVTTGVSELFINNRIGSILLDNDYMNNLEKKGFDFIGPLFITRLLGFDYNAKEDSYYTREGCIQQQWGFCDAIDKWGPGLGMDLDTEIATFMYEGQEFRIQLWKGEYGNGTSVGSEFAIYSRPESEALANPYVEGSADSRYILYEAVDQKYQPKVKQTTCYVDADGQKRRFSCDTRNYGDTDDYWNLNIRSNSGAEKDEVSSVNKIDCSQQGEGFAKAMYESLQKEDNLIVKMIDPTTIEIKYN